jgi:hypothetical protein
MFDEDESRDNNTAEMVRHFTDIAALVKERDEARAEVARLKTKLIVEDDRLGYINAHSERRIAALEKALTLIAESPCLAMCIPDAPFRCASCVAKAALAKG